MERRAAAPVLNVLTGYGPNGSIILSGQVTAANPGNLTVTFTGMVDAQVTTAADGSFSADFRGRENNQSSYGCRGQW